MCIHFRSNTTSADISKEQTSVPRFLVTRFLASQNHQTRTSSGSEPHDSVNSTSMKLTHHEPQHPPCLQPTSKQHSWYHQHFSCLSSDVDGRRSSDPLQFD
ncbi:hypothetical protein Droror1_Dr00004837 [Drosera rotundifolia]